MGVLDKFKDLIGIEEIDDEMLEEELEPQQAPAERRKAEPRATYTRNTVREKVVPMGNRAVGNAFKLMVIEPDGFEECPKLVDSLKSRKPVIINLEKIDSDTARKIFDFLSGATYALNGNVQKVANNIFIFAPENVDISSTNEASPKGFDFGSSQKDGWR
ncbi:MAG: cell division protein SepF [Firmicutes bacterium]|nr:cell division protein SepF [Bacillota bacterium]